MHPGKGTSKQYGYRGWFRPRQNTSGWPGNFLTNDLTTQETMANLTKIADWAESIGISRQQGYAAVKRCAIPVTDGKLDPDVARILYEKHTRKRANGKRGAISAGADAAIDSGSPAGAAPDGKPTGSGYDGSRARREEAEAAISEIKLAEMQGKYLVKSEVAAIIYEIARAMRDGLTNSARRIAADVASLASAQECEEVIDREHRALLDSMTHAIATRLAAPPEESRAP